MSELPQAIELVDAAMRDGSDQTMLTDYPLVYRHDNLPNIQIIKVNGKVVSVVPFLMHEVEFQSFRISIGVISPTATDPAHRRRGFAMRCLQECLLKMDRREIDLSVLWTDVPVFEFYAHAEYQAIRSQHDVFQLTSRDAPLFLRTDDSITRLDLDNLDELEAVRRLHENESCCVRRPPLNYKPLFSLPKMTTLLARRNGQVAAYLVFSGAINKPGIVEAGGAQDAIQTLLSHVLIHFGEGGTVIPAWTNQTPHVLKHVLSRISQHRREPASDVHQMIRISSPSRFLKKISSILDAGTAATLGAGNLSRRILTAVLFGSHPEMPLETSLPVRDPPPFSLPVWMLDHS